MDNRDVIEDEITNLNIKIPVQIILVVTSFSYVEVLNTKAENAINVKKAVKNLTLGINNKLNKKVDVKNLNVKLISGTAYIVLYKLKLSSSINLNIQPAKSTLGSII